MIPSMLVLAAVALCSVAGGELWFLSFAAVIAQSAASVSGTNA